MLSRLRGFFSKFSKRRFFGKKRLSPRRLTRNPPLAPGKVIYSNPVPARAAAGKGALLSIKNLEYVRVGSRMGGVQNSETYSGRIKFSGKASKTCVITRVTSNARLDYDVVIERLNAAKVDRPKMAYITKNGESYVVQEAFVRKGRTLKFSETNGLPGSLNIAEKGSDLMLFTRAMEQAGALAHAKLEIRRTGNAASITVFKSVKLRNGSEKLMVQGIDGLFPRDDPRAAWDTSRASLVDYVCSGNPGNRKMAEEVALRIGTRMGFYVWK